ncbi:MAG TPA: SGNH/GDSL hydrolase family protein [Pyrinomonadaceae bacterium]|nr:SGNH/GDSL hydrolase family protein [Pyrinomonadaceae bacterium]
MSDRQNVTRNWSRRKRRVVRLTLLLLSVAFALAVCEVALRLTDYSFVTFYTTDDERGFRLRPGARGVYRKEGESYVEINSAGLRDREHAREKPAGTLRIAVVGDSYAEALQVPVDQAFWAVAERKLNEECDALAGRRVEVLNFGVSGYGTAQELITVRRHVFDYSPDVVLLAFTTNNDVTDNLRTFKRSDEMPYFVLRDGRLTLDDSFRDTRSFRLRKSLPSRAGAWLRDNSRVLQAVNHAHYAFKNYLARRRAARQQQQQAPRQTHTPAAATSANSAAAQTAPPPANVGDLGIDNLIYREPLDATWEEAWRVTEALLVEMREEVGRRGARFVVATLSNGPQVLPDPAARDNFARRFGATDLFYPDLRVRALGERRGFTVFNLAPELQAYAERRRLYLHGFGADIGNGHWNADGHRAAGELLARKLCAELSK